MKKISFIFLIVMLISFNSFSAVVSDNDGAAFVTKSEFEALKDNFNNQITQYSLSIDSKIDGAIASYLAGFQLQKKEEIVLPLRNWNSVTMMNGCIYPKFAYPSANISAYLMGGFAPSEQIDWICQYWSFANAIYNQSQSSNSIRPTIKNVKEDGTDDSKMTWDWVKTKWIEKISANYNQGSTENLYALEVSGATNKFFVYQMACFNDPGYVANLDNSIDNIWKVNYGYYSSYNSYGYHTFTNGTNILSKNLVLEVDAKEENVIYKHICNWNNDFAHWEVYNENFLNTFRLSNYDTLKANDWFSSMTRDGVWYGEKNANHCKGASRIAKKFESLDMNNKTYNQSSTDYNIHRVGLYNLDTEPQKIYQSQDKIVQNVDREEKELPLLNLVDGFVLFYAKDEDEIEWEPVFDNLSSSESGLIDSSTEVCLMLSTVPFENGTSTEGTGDQELIEVQNFGSAAKTKYPTSINRKMKLKWKMPKDSFVYAKWYPVLSDSSYKDTKNWQADLDLDKCGSYLRLKGDS